MLEPKSDAKASIEIKKSQFIAIAKRVHSAEEVRAEIKETRAHHAEAHHVVHAFVTSGGDIFGMSDDREPKGTAGRPVLEVVKGSGIDNLLIMVVRYFGGTKLGTGGLVKAYTASAQEVLKVLETQEIIQTCDIAFSISYDIYDQVKRELFELFIEGPCEKFEEQVTISGQIPEDQLEMVKGVVRELSSGRASFF